MQRPPPRLNATETIQNYRKRRGRTMPVIFSGLAVVLLVGGAVALISWLTGETPPAFLVSPTPTTTSTPTPPPPTSTSIPTSTPTEIPTETLTPTPVRPFTYTVEQGDTLIALAERFELDVLVLMAANAIVDPGSLFVGQELVIPPLDARLPTATPLPPNLRPGTLIPYIVQFGDTLELIAAKFNSTAEAIADRNDIENANEIAIGQVLQIPVNLVTPTPSLTPGPSVTATAQP